METAYLVFRESTAFEKYGAKTKKWYVIAKNSGSILGEIKWYARWRQYCFFPEPQTLFNRGCLSDITAFVEQAMNDRRVGHAVE